MDHDAGLARTASMAVRSCWKRISFTVTPSASGSSTNMMVVAMSELLVALRLLVAFTDRVRACRVFDKRRRLVVRSAPDLIAHGRAHRIPREARLRCRSGGRKEARRRVTFTVRLIAGHRPLPRRASLREISPHRTALRLVALVTSVTLNAVRLVWWPSNCAPKA